MSTSESIVSAPAAASAGGHGSVGLLGATALVVGSMIGSGIYLLPASLGAVGSISILGWIAASVDKEAEFPDDDEDDLDEDADGDTDF